MSFYAGKKVFIAGGAGLIGQALIRALVPLGAEITATEHLTRKVDPEYRSKIIIAPNVDLRNEFQHILYRGQDIVFWAAAKVGGAKAIRENPMDLVHYNLELAAKNIQAAVQAGVKRFCYVSSSYVYPASTIPSRERDTEEFDVPEQHYGLGWIKRFMEKLCAAHALTGKTRFALVRPTAIYGPHDNFDFETCHVIPALIRKVAEGQNPLEVWGDGSEERQFTYVDDLAQGLLLATERLIADWRTRPEVINIAPAQVSTVRDVAQCLLELTHEHKPGVSYIGSIKYLGDKPKAISRRLVNTEKCKQLLDYECKTSLADGLEKTLNWYKANNTGVRN